MPRKAKSVLWECAGATFVAWTLCRHCVPRLPRRHQSELVSLPAATLLRGRPETEPW